MASSLYWIEGPWRGRLAIIPRPRGGDWLEDEVSDWRKVGIDVVVSFLTTDEVDELDLEEEEQVCQAHDLRFVSFPIPDQEVPPSKQAAESLVNDLEQALADGKNVALHCSKASADQRRLPLLCLWRLAMRRTKPSRKSLRRGVSKCPKLSNRNDGWRTSPHTSLSVRRDESAIPFSTLQLEV